MCGQENKTMSDDDLTVETLTQECIELRQTLNATKDDKKKEELVLNHIARRAKKDNHISSFPKGLEWFNVSEELSAKKHLSGKIVILDFFTYCCINCMHILPDLAALEAEYTIQHGLVVIGVHSAKFSNERDSDKILSAVQRYKIKHPVVNDAKLVMWRDMGIVCWPSIVILGPTFKPLAAFVGEGHHDELFLYTKVALSYFKSRNEISNHELPLRPAQHLLPSGARDNLLFPGKVIGFENNAGDERIIVSDTGNNRIIIMNIDGTVEHIIGGCSSGFEDGNFQDARFHSPQGICTHGNNIYIADNENHAIRVIELNSKTVSTIAGTGCQGHDYEGGKIGKEQVLSSPWDVAIYQHNQLINNELKCVPVLLIAMAGTHQIWACFFEETHWWKKKQYKAGTCMAIVGNGREANRNNTYPHAASLAQPSGLAISLELQLLFFADSESSSIRKVSLQDGRVSSLAGGSRDPTDLHNFGDVDGAHHCAKLQHPLGVAWDKQRQIVYVADTYNHKIKEIDCNGKCITLYGANKPTNDHIFDEPSGLGLLPKKNILLIADTNNHSIKIIHLQTQTITVISNLKYSNITDFPIHRTYNFSTEISNKCANLIISFTTELCNNAKLAPNTQQKWSLSTLPKAWTAESPSGLIATPIKVKLPEGDAFGQLIILLSFVVCETTRCIPKKFKIIFHVSRKGNAPEDIQLNEKIDIQ